MSNERTRDRGNLFTNTEKKKPSQPDLQGDCTIATTPYEIRGWRRGDQIALSLAPPRGDQNTYPPDVFRGELERPVGGARSAPGGARGLIDVPAKPARPAKGAEPVPTPAWAGDISGDDVAYTVRAFEKQGKSGMYFTLSFERIDHQAPRAGAGPTAELAD